MRTTVDPKLEFDWKPALLALLTVVSIGIVANFVVMRPGLIGWAALLAGVVASFSSGYYDASGNSAVVGTFFGILLLTPVLAYTRVVFVFGVDGAGDTAFASLALAGGWILIVTIVLLPVAYIGAALSDTTRKKVGGPIGFKS